MYDADAREHGDVPDDRHTSAHEDDNCADPTELAWLRAENALLRTERDILVQVATGFAHDAKAALLRGNAKRPVGEPDIA